MNAYDAMLDVLNGDRYNILSLAPNSASSVSNYTSAEITSESFEESVKRQIHIIMSLMLNIMAESDLINLVI